MISEIGKKHMWQLFLMKNEKQGVDFLRDLPKSELMMLMLDAGAMIDLVLIALGVDKKMVYQEME